MKTATSSSSCCSLLMLAAAALVLLVNTAQTLPIGISQESEKNRVESKFVILSRHAGRYLQLLSNSSVHATGRDSDPSAQWRVQLTGFLETGERTFRLENVQYSNHHLVYARVGTDCEVVMGHDPSTPLEPSQVLAACSTLTSAATEPTSQPTRVATAADQSTTAGDLTTSVVVTEEGPTTGPVSSTGASTGAQTEAGSGAVPSTEAPTGTPVFTESNWLIQSDSANPIITSLRLASEDCYLSFDRRRGFPILCEAQRFDRAAQLTFDGIFEDRSSDAL